jgi:hypothetical protein
MGYHEGVIRNVTSRDDGYLNIKTLFDPNVIFGREDGKGYWHGPVGSDGSEVIG